MEDQRLLELLIKRENGELSLVEHKELIPLLNNEKGERLAMYVSKIYDNNLKLDCNGEELVKNSVPKLRALISGEGKLVELQKNKPKNLMRYVAVAASILILLGTAFFIYQRPIIKNELAGVVETKKGSKSNIVLPDGTKVWMNSDTRLTYDKDFGENSRDVSLIGEAYFDVVKDKSKPFIVHTSTMDIKVLGTAFNVKAYQDDHLTEATLLRGAIEVKIKNKAGKTIFLNPNEKIKVVNSQLPENTEQNINEVIPPDVSITTLPALKKDTLAREVMWTINRLSFDYETFEDISKSLERWYGVKIKIDNQDIKTKKFRGVFEEKSIEEVLDALKIIERFNYEKRNNTVTIK